MHAESFSADEWTTLKLAPLWVFRAVAGADGHIDEEETAALTKGLAEWSQFKGTLVQEVLRAVGDELGDLMDRCIADGRGMLRGLSEVADILERAGSIDQAKQFKSAMLLIGRNVANASGPDTSGLGDRISQEEKAALSLVLVGLRMT